jgi:multidrug resistance efflux pump
MKQLRCSLGLPYRPPGVPPTERIFQEELQHVQRSLDVQSEQLRAALASAKADTDNKPPPERTPDDTSARGNPSKTGLENTLEKLDLANQEISRLKLLLQEWKKYGSDWKRDAQTARARGSELQLREDALSAQAKAADESRALLDSEIRELTSALADQTVRSPYFLRHAAIRISCLLGSGGGPTYCLSGVCKTSSRS